MKHLVTLITAALLVLAGCGQETPKPAARETKAPAAAPALPTDLFPATAPGGAKTLSDARSTAKAGDIIVFTGYIGGREQPFTEGRALVLVVDAVKVEKCDDHEEGTWDACCTPPKVIAANSATVQVVDASGSVMKVGLEGKGNLVPGATVTVSGKVREASAAALIVDATAIVAVKAG